MLRVIQAVTIILAKPTIKLLTTIIHLTSNILLGNPIIPRECIEKEIKLELREEGERFNLPSNSLT